MIIDSTDRINSEIRKSKDIELTRKFQESMLSSYSKSLANQSRIVSLQEANNVQTKKIVNGQASIAKRQKQTLNEIQTLKTKAKGPGVGQSLANEGIKAIGTQLLKQLF